MFRGQVRGLDRSKVQVFSSGASPRACIVMDKTTQCSQLFHLGTRDLAVVVGPFRRGGGRAVLASAYLPYDSPAPPPSPELSRLVEWCERKGLPLLVGCDANAHHVTWGSTNCNPRGQVLLEFIARSKLVTMNRGSKPTFVTSRRREVIDITLVNDNLAMDVLDWRVSDEESLSDHRFIRFKLEGDMGPPVRYRNPRKANWQVFRERLADEIGGRLSRITTPEEIEGEAQAINAALGKAFDAACPERTLRAGRAVPWWNTELTSLRRASRRAGRKAYTENTPETWLAYRNLLRDYKKSIRKSKAEAWRRQCQEIDSQKSTAKLHKALAKEGVHQVGSLTLPDGSFTASSAESLSHLLEIHFPGSVEANAQDPGSQGYGRKPNPMDWREAAATITPDKVSWAIKAFQPLKSPGPDGIIPVMLQQGLPVISRILCRLFRASLACAYIPKLWRQVRVVFIPKVGREDYSVAKAFRPISLSSFLLKTVERLVDRRLRERILRDYPLHPNQHAYQPGKSTETALHCLIGRIERALDRKQFALGAFFDIEGAFDNAPFDAMVGALEARGTDVSHCAWVRCMLESRQITGINAQASKTVSAVRGCPQGGVLSPLLWALTVDEVLTRLEKAGIYCQGYSDDGVILVEGQDLGTVCGLVQTGLQLVSRWCGAKGLAINPRKTELVLFTKSRSRAGFRAPRLGGVDLKLADQVKFLGVIIDSKLTWKQHIQTKSLKAVKALWLARRALGKTWGLTPQLTLWLYKAIVRPIVTYAAVVWWARVELDTAKAALGRVQRLACLSITGAMRTTPTAAMEMLLGLNPLWVEVRATAMATCHRLVKTGLWWSKGHEQGHRKIRRMMLEQLPVLRLRSDRIVPQFAPGDRLRAEIPSAGDWEADMPVKSQITRCYTDGSLNQVTGLAGAGVFCEEPCIAQSLPLGHLASVFQAEVVAILYAAKELGLRAPLTGIIILSDSQAAIKAVSGHRLKSALVLECREALEELAATRPVTLTWIPGHSGFPGNEAADVLARQGSSKAMVGPEPALPLPPSAASRVIRAWADSKGHSAWAAVDGCRQTRLLAGSHSLKRSRELIKLDRQSLRCAVSLLTGHCCLRYHLSILGIEGNPFCSCEADAESAEHFLCHCHQYDQLREQIFGSSRIEARDVQNAPAKLVVRFARESGRFEN